MIFYFSGTGNSLYTAQKLGEKLNEQIMDIAPICQNEATVFNYTIAENEKLGLVFPIYAWQPPTAVKVFLDRLSLEGEPGYTFAVCTMGESAGYGMSKLKKWLKNKGIHLNSGYSLVMPDNYVVLFEAPSHEDEVKKLAHADFMIQKIAKAVTRERMDFFPIKKGSWPLAKSYIVNPMFQKKYMDTKRFYVTGDCIGCGLCERICTSTCIHMKDDRPVWDKGKCNMCLACLNRCPKQAIQYTKKTEKRGRYVNPILKP